METQTHSKASVTVPKNGRVVTDADQYEDSMTDLDDFDLAKIFTPQVNMDISPVMAPAMVEQIEALLAKGNSFRTLNDKYVEKFVVQGNEELYELLGGVYGFMLTVNESPYRDHILMRMREWLSSQKGIVLNDTTAMETVVVRYIMPTDRQTAFNYARVMKVAFLEKIAAKDLAGYIKGRGGITKIQDTQANEEAAKDKKELEKKKTTLYEKVLIAKVKGSGIDLKPENQKIHFNLAPRAKDSSIFDFALLTQTAEGTWRVNQIVTVPKSVGDPFIQYIGKHSIPDDRVDEAKEFLDKLRAKLGITSGYGMEPGDVGYEGPGNVTKPPEEKDVTEESEAAE